jgi:hypothetical protein
VDHRDVAGAVAVRVRIDVVRLAMRRPARVRDADAALSRRGSVASTCRTFPAALCTRSPPRVITATPAESYPRYSSLCRPANSIGNASWRPT